MAILAVINFSENGNKAFILIGLGENIEKCYMAILAV